MKMAIVEEQTWLGKTRRSDFGRKASGQSTERRGGTASVASLFGMGSRHGGCGACCTRRLDALSSKQPAEGNRPKGISILM